VSKIGHDYRKRNAYRLVRNEIKLATEERWNDMKLHGRNEGMKE